ncbi:peptidoglycan/LPS O-acetylase OafA/YrhL [Kitasatospora sp. MAA4]|uniref:acyltransferase family protein n=1 Tax=Kitasatospora sp. MAA4 TaxID=3035093 RepID=UPI002472F72A|nr:acyltransferase [Kitasatospora sp. MAA4]MDH6135914.1 peptidoglycan/LPS O-acetylase OafA/YrhL [Kitasatospora sp. MAA4]
MTVIEQQPAEQSVGASQTARAARPAVRLGWLDALRGIAALLVAVHHFGLLAMFPPAGPWIEKHFDLGIYAVMLFFLVSGYIVPASLERRGDVRGFWVGRVFRIYPLLLIVITLSLLILPKDFSAVPGVVTSHPLRSYLANLTLLHEMLNIPSALGAMWTLCYEMVFYFFVSALFVKGWHRQSAGISVFFAGAALLLGAFVTPAMITTNTATTQHLIMATVVVMATGLLCVFTGRPELVRIGAMVLGGLGAVLLFLNARSTFFESMMILATMFAGTAIFRAEKKQIDPMVAVITCGFVLTSGFLVGYLYNHGDALNRTWTSEWIGFSAPYLGAWLTFGFGMLLRNRRWPRPLTWLGAISYSVYVVHIPVLWSVFWLEKYVHFAKHGAAKFVPALIFLAGVLVFSQLTYKLIEMPGQNLGKKVAKMLDRRLPQTGPKFAGEQAEAAVKAP